MRRKLLTLLLSSLSILALSNGLLAKNGRVNLIPSETSTKINIIEQNVSQNKGSLNLKYRKLEQFCKNSTAYDCSQAMEIVGDAANTTYNVCDEYGWVSETCAAYVSWFGATCTWAFYVCGNSNNIESVIKPKFPLLKESLTRDDRQSF